MMAPVSGLDGKCPPSRTELTAIAAADVAAPLIKCVVSWLLGFSFSKIPTTNRIFGIVLYPGLTPDYSAFRDSIALVFLIKESFEIGNARSESDP